MIKIIITWTKFLHSDSSACLFKNNKVIAASEEERFTRVKPASKFPIHSLIFIKTSKY